MKKRKEAKCPFLFFIYSQNSIASYIYILYKERSYSLICLI